MFIAGMVAWLKYRDRYPGFRPITVPPTGSAVEVLDAARGPPRANRRPAPDNPEPPPRTRPITMEEEEPGGTQNQCSWTRAFTASQRVSRTMWWFLHRNDG